MSKSIELSLMGRLGTAAAIVALGGVAAACTSSTASKTISLGGTKSQTARSATPATSQQASERAAECGELFATTNLNMKNGRVDGFTYVAAMHPGSCGKTYPDIEHGYPSAKSVGTIGVGDYVEIICAEKTEGHPIGLDVIDTKTHVTGNVVLAAGADVEASYHLDTLASC